jgi:amino-acid N-acetyltransferase
VIRKARIKDVSQIQKLINLYAARDEMLPRSLNEIYENLRDYFVFELEGRVIGCGALHIDWEDLAEIKSVAVHPDNQQRGIGRAIVEKCIEEAKELGLKRVFALTYKPQFFARLGFSDVDKNDLPHKVWSECINCPKFPDCEESAVILILNS